MKGYFAFLKKEWMENIRTYRLMIVFLVFVLFGISSPLMAKFLPDLIGAMDMNGIQLTLPEPSALDCYAQFFQNITQIGLLVFVFVFSGCISQEVYKGTLINVISKGLSRKAIVLAKFTMISLLWSGALLLAFILTLGYTWYLFPEDMILQPSFAILCLWLFGMMIISLLCLGSTLFKNSYGALLFLVLMLAGLFVFNMFPNLQQFNPLYLINTSMDMLQPTYTMSEAYASICVSIICSILSLLGSLYIFQRKVL